MDDLPGNLVQGMEDQRISPHCDSNGVVSIRQTVRTNEESF